MNPIIAPSILSANFADLKADIQLINESAADWFHVDVMDGVFVPNISFGFPVMQALKSYANKPLDVHLMIVEPDKYIQQFAEAGADIITVHFEACTHLNRTIQLIKQYGSKAGVAINPHTSVTMLEDILPYIDLVLVMSVNPGFGGQKFIEQTYKKVEQLNSMKQSLAANFVIEVDGGVDIDNLPKLLNAGANAFVAGNAIFKASSPSQIIQQMKASIPVNHK